MELIVIAAIATHNRVIGHNGKVPWKIPEDSRRFRQLTLSHAVIMGRRTWVEDLEERPLHQRHNIVVSSTLPAQSQPGSLSIARSLQEALALTTRTDKVFVMGGAGLYAQALPRADTLELTWVEGQFQGDTYFPEIEPILTTQFQLADREDHPGYRFETYRRIKAA